MNRIGWLVGALCCVGMTAAGAANTVKARANANPDRYNPLIFGSFLEHFDNQVYGGVFDAVVTCDEQRTKYALALVNKSPDKVTPVAVDFASLGKGTPATVRARVLRGDAPDAFNSIKNPERVHIEEQVLEVRDGVIEVPAHAVLVLRVE